MGDKRGAVKSSYIRGFLLLIAVAYLGQLAHLQLFNDKYRVQADATAISKNVLYPSRGLIYDRNGKLLVHNDPLYDMYIIHNRLDPQMDTARLCDLLDIDRQEFIELTSKDWSDKRYSPNSPYLFRSRITPEMFARLQEFLHEYPGLEVRNRSVRGYNYPHAAHLLGYMSEVDQEQIDLGEGKYEKRDYYGATGMEKIYEKELRGKKGMEYLIKDKFGRSVDHYAKGNLDSFAVPGIDLTATIDIELQKYAAELMEGKIGSVVAIEPGTGEILAMVSSPGYDPQMLSVHEGRTEAFFSLQQDSLNPFYNRALMARYPPGSTFKPVVALIGMQDGLIDPDHKFHCQGAYYYKFFRWGCHAGAGVHNLRNAITSSCNTYFYSSFRRIIDQFGFRDPEKGLDHFNKYMKAFGFGRKLGIDMPNENSGSIPTVDYYDEIYEGKGDWRSTYIISNGIGQGEIQFTTLQLANLAAILANEGHYYVPHVARELHSPNGAIGLVNPKNPVRVPIDRKHFAVVNDGLEGAVSYGTATMARLPGIRVCGKTGTSENPHGKDHSVFFAFAPREDPKIAVAVCVENAGWGGSYAAPIGGLVIEKHLNNEINRSRQWIEDRMKNAFLIASN